MKRWIARLGIIESPVGDDVFFQTTSSWLDDDDYVFIHLMFAARGLPTWQYGMVDIDDVNRKALIATQYSRWRCKLKMLLSFSRCNVFLMA